MRIFNMTKLLLASAAVALSGAGAKADGAIFRQSADFFKFDGTEFSTALGPSATPGAGGASFYTKTVKLGPVQNVLYVTAFATGDVGGSPNELLWSCTITSGTTTSFCNPGQAFSLPVGTVGWVNLLNTGGTLLEDNAISYSWCVALPKRTKVESFTITLSMASANGTSTVFLETGHVYLDTSAVSKGDKCIAGASIASDSELELKALAKKGGKVADTVTKHAK